MRDFKFMVRKILKNFLFLLILGVLLGLVSHVFSRTALQDETLVHSRNKSIVKLQKEKKNTIDVMILGDSLSYTAFSPMQLWEEHGIASFIGGQAGQSIQETYYMLKRAFENQNPRLVILEADVLFRRQQGASGLTMSLAAMGYYHFPFFAYHDMWKNLFLDKKYPEEDFKGFEIREAVEPYQGSSHMIGTDRKEDMTQMVQNYLENILRLCREKEAQVLLISTPSPLNYNYKKYNTLKEYGEREDVSYVDLNMKEEELGIDWETDSLDKGDHLNLSGAEKVTEYMGNYLKDHYSLPDRRGNPSFKSWEEDFQKFDKKAKEKLEAIRKHDKMKGDV